MDELLDSMWREQLGEEAAAAAGAAESDASSSSESEAEEESISASPPPSSAASSQQPAALSHHLWRADVQPGKAVLRHVRRLEKQREKARANHSSRASSSSSALLLVDLGAELQRHKAMSTLTCFFLNRVNRSLELDLRIPPFERWAASQRREDGKGAGAGAGTDPILPDPRVEEAQDQAGRRLLRRELLESGAGKQEVGRLLEHLDKMAVKLLGQLHRSVTSSGEAAGGGGGAAAVKVALEAGKGRYVLQYKGLALACNQTHYDKLRVLFDRRVKVWESHQQWIEPKISSPAPFYATTFAGMAMAVVPPSSRRSGASTTRFSPCCCATAPWRGARTGAGASRGPSTRRCVYACIVCT